MIRNHNILIDELQGKLLKTTLTLRELLATYQRLYERQFHEPLPDSQKVLLASLPRFEKPTIPGRISHASTFDEPRSFQQDDDSNKEENEVTTEEDISTVEPKEVASTTTDSAVRTTEEDDSSVATDVSSTLTPAPEKEDASTATTPTAADPKKRLKGSANDEQQNQTAPVKEEAAQKKGTLKNTPEEELPGAAAFPNAAVMNAVKKVEALPMETVNVMPSTADDVPKKVASQPSMLDAPLVRKEQLNSASRIPEQNPRFSAPSTPVETVQAPRRQLPKAAPDVEGAPRAPSQPLQPLPQGRPEQEFTQTVPDRSAIGAGVIPTRIPKVHTARTDPDSTRHFVPKQLPSRPAPRMQSRPQPINLEVMNHVVVPRGPISGPPQQSRRVNGQVRTRQPLRRQQPPVRAPLPVRPAPEVNLPTPPPVPRTFQKPTNLIVIHDGRVIDLTPQQQRDLSLVLSSMVTANETGARRRAPTRRAEPVVNNRGSRNQFFSNLH
ncbi:hypothetical protein TELCIR_01967 [Teladorsagia circumcincta]|uniref:Uncharacterized protein n=1 Tax=Teladorsagia circumcincta TaxID=45464 RepID=A0A2G9V0G3_TELCI|nr:hypothetical protein TELCIR_01967 [Teladorsagia circumcincta]